MVACKTVGDYNFNQAKIFKKFLKGKNEGGNNHPDGRRPQMSALTTDNGPLQSSG